MILMALGLAFAAIWMGWGLATSLTVPWLGFAQCSVGAFLFSAVMIANHLVDIARRGK